MNSTYLVGLHSLVTELKSVVIALPAIHQVITPQEALETSQLEELYQRSIYGEIPGAHDVEMATLNARIAANILYLNLIKSK